MRRLKLSILSLFALTALTSCQQRGEPELSLTQEQWRRVRTNILAELPEDEVETPLNIHAGERLSLRGITGLRRQVQAGHPLEFTTYWEVLEETTADIRFDYTLVQGEFEDRSEHKAMDGQLPSRLWKKGDILRDRVSMLVQPMFHGVTKLQINVLADNEPLALHQDGAPHTGDLGDFIAVWNPPHISARYTDERIVIDGIASERAWNAAPKTEPWRDPRDGTTSDAQPTTAQLLWSEEGLYLFIKAQDEHIWSTLHRRDQHLWEEEVIEVFLDPKRTAKNYVEIQVNPLNTVFDALFPSADERNIERAKAHNLSGLRTAVSLQGTLNDPTDRDGHWTVEMFIPFADLPDLERDERGRPAPMGLNLYRYDRPDNDTVHTTAWSPVGAGTFHRPERFGVIRWSGAPSPAEEEPVLSDGPVPSPN